MILDPRYKMQVLKYCYQKIYEDDETASLKVNDVLFHLQRFLDEYTPSTTNGNNTPTQTSNFSFPSAKPTRRKWKFDIMVFENEACEFPTLLKSKLDVYLEDGKLDRIVELNILQFWKVNESKYEELAHLARDILTIPFTTVASESTFSIGGRILNKWRSSYLPENVEALITSRS